MPSFVLGYNRRSRNMFTGPKLPPVCFSAPHLWVVREIHLEHDRAELSSVTTAEGKVCTYSEALFGDYLCFLVISSVISNHLYCSLSDGFAGALRCQDSIILAASTAPGAVVSWRGALARLYAVFGELLI